MSPQPPFTKDDHISCSGRGNSDHPGRRHKLLVGRGQPLFLAHQARRCWTVRSVGVEPNNCFSKDCGNGTSQPQIKDNVLNQLPLVIPFYMIIQYCMLSKNLKNFGHLSANDEDAVWFSKLEDLQQMEFHYYYQWYPWWEQGNSSISSCIKYLVFACSILLYHACLLNVGNDRHVLLRTFITSILIY